MLKLQIRQTLAVLSDRIKQFLRLIPSKACICDGFSVDVIYTDLLIAWLNIALDHETFYHSVKLRIYLTAVKNLACDTNLLLVVLVGVGVVGIHDHCRVGKVLCVVFVIEKTKILIMVVRDGFPMFVYRTTKDCVGERVTGGLNFPASVNEAVSALCCNDGFSITL